MMSTVGSQLEVFALLKSREPAHQTFVGLLGVATSALAQTNTSRFSSVYMRQAMASCRWLFMHWIPCALHLARAKAGRSMAARIAIMAMTTSNSINVNPLEWRGRFIVNSREFIRLFIRPLFH